MRIATRNYAACMFCGGRTHLRYHDVFHPFKREYGPFDICICEDCGSAQTDPAPSRENLAALYCSYQNGLSKLHRAIMSDDPQTAVYRLCVNRIVRLSGRHSFDVFTWLDVGGGGGEFAALMAAAFPKSHGVVVDLHPRPSSLTGISSVEWHQLDINQDTFSLSLSQADIVVAIGVWEHVLHPDLFVRNLLSLVLPQGLLYLLCPNNTSLASRIFGKSWPLFTPGEHLTIPTRKGAVCCLRREWNILGNKEAVSVSARGLMLPYTLRYLMRRLGADVVGRMLPAGLSLPLSIGVLEANAIRSANVNDNKDGYSFT